MQSIYITFSKLLACTPIVGLFYYHNLSRVLEMFVLEQLFSIYILMFLINMYTSMQF